MGRYQELPRKKLPTFGNHAEARVMDTPEECEMCRCAVVFERCLPNYIADSVLMHKI